MHLLETRYQRDWADEAFPDGIVTYLDRIGLLTPRLTLAHCTWARPAELELIAARGATIVVNTCSNLGLRSGVAPLAEMARRGCRIALGVDGMALDGDDDLLRELRLAHLLHSGTGFDLNLRPADVLAMVIENGRRCVLDAEHGGALAAGKPADILLLDWQKLDDERLRADIDPMDLLFAHTTRRHIHELIVAGRTVVREGEIVGIDYPSLRDELLAKLRSGIAASTAFMSALGELDRIIATHFAQTAPCC
jgi:cytosine/adenosine deaminase-related metal-dependent hydrolase